MIARGAMAFNSWRAPNSHPYRAPRILVTLKSIMLSGQRFWPSVPEKLA